MTATYPGFPPTPPPTPPTPQYPAQPSYPGAPGQLPAAVRAAVPVAAGLPGAEMAPPQQPLAQGSIDDFFNQPSAGGGKSLSFKVVGTRYIGIVTRPLGNGDIQQQTDVQGKPQFFRDGRPKFVMKVPLQMQPSAEHPDGLGVWFVKGQARDELARAMSEAGAPAGPPEQGSIIDISYVGDRQAGAGFNPAKQFAVVYTRPDGSTSSPAPAGRTASPKPSPGSSAPTTATAAASPAPTASARRRGPAAAPTSTSWAPASVPTRPSCLAALSTTANTGCSTITRSPRRDRPDAAGPIPGAVRAGGWQRAGGCAHRLLDRGVHGERSGRAAGGAVLQRRVVP
jgi:hypothetical protein